jgi:hypothetical protein
MRAFNEQLKMIRSSQIEATRIVLRTGIGAPGPIEHFDGLAMNANRVFSSELAHTLAKESNGGFGLTYYIRKGNVAVCSLRSEKDGPNVSVIAASYGGGGHRNAAGFEIPMDRLFHLLNGEAG